MRTHRRLSIVGVSLGCHLVLVLGLFVAGFWHLDRLEAGRHTIDLRITPDPPPAPAGSPAAAALPAMNRKQPKEIPKEPVQPEPPQHVDETPAVVETETGSGGGGSGSDAGSGTGPGSPIDVGACEVPPCGKSEPPAKKPVVQTVTIVPPAVIRSLWISGDRQIQPPDPTKLQIVRAGQSRVTAAFKICLTADGGIASTTLLRSSGYTAYDAALTAGIAAWRYRPFQVGGRGVPVCGMVTFVYAIE